MSLYITRNDINLMHVDLIAYQDNQDSFSIDLTRQHRFKMSVVVNPYVSRNDESLANAYISILNKAKEEHLSCIVIKMLGDESYLPRFLLSTCLKTIASYIEENELSVGVIVPNDQLVEDNIDLIIKYHVSVPSEYIYIVNEFNEVRDLVNKYYKELNKNKDNSLDELIKKETIDISKYSTSDVPFKNHLCYLISKCGDDVETIYKRAGIARKTFIRLLSDDKYVPSKETMIRLCIGLKLDFEQSKKFLEKLDYQFLNSYVDDMIIKEFIQKRKYDIHSINVVLNENHCPLLAYCSED